MRVLGLDLSSKSGYAIIEDSKLICYGKITTDGIISIHDLSEYNFLYQARAIANRIVPILKKYKPDYIIIEQTNIGRSRETQKSLEFIHYSVLEMLEAFRYDKKVSYVDTSAWRKALNIRLSSEQRKHNKKNAELRKKRKSGEPIQITKKGCGKITWKHLSVQWVNEKFGLKFKLVDNDIADAIALAQYGYNQYEKIKSGTCKRFDIKVFE